MSIQKSTNFETTQWAGGSTTQLYIYPPNADFKKGDFRFRLSIASIEIDESVFTKLDNVDRILLLLEGNLNLTHEGHHEIDLRPFEQDSFSGGWNTKSTGIAKDFNLMSKGAFKRRVLKAEKLEANGRFSKKSNSVQEFRLVYCLSGQLAHEQNGQDFILDRNQLILVNDDEVSLKATEDSVLVHCHLILE